MLPVGCMDPGSGSIHTCSLGTSPWPSLPLYHNTTSVQYWGAVVADSNPYCIDVVVDEDAAVAGTASIADSNYLRLSPDWPSCWQ